MICLSEILLAFPLSIHAHVAVPMLMISCPVCIALLLVVIWIQRFVVRNRIYLSSKTVLAIYSLGKRLFNNIKRTNDCMTSMGGHLIYDFNIPKQCNKINIGCVS
ncbi:MAG: hypothetical protein OXC30_00300 [Alphaproteobacteria bacterium]|nr:hypothetical protein [Alphaproteobacteria bacterium]